MIKTIYPLSTVDIENSKTNHIFKVKKKRPKCFLELKKQAEKSTYLVDPISMILFVNHSCIYVYNVYYLFLFYWNICLFIDMVIATLQYYYIQNSKQNHFFKKRIKIIDTINFFKNLKNNTKP